MISAEEWLPGLHVSKGGALLESLAAEAELRGRGKKKKKEIKDTSEAGRACGL